MAYKCGRVFTTSLKISAHKYRKHVEFQKRKLPKADYLKLQIESQILGINPIKPIGRYNLATYKCSFCVYNSLDKRERDMHENQHNFGKALDDSRYLMKLKEEKMIQQQQQL